MGAIIFKQERAFAVEPHLPFAFAKLESRYHDPTVLHSSFRTIVYGRTDQFQYELGFGGREPAHFDMPTYQAILILQMNRWVIKGARDSSACVFQSPRDLIVLDTSRKHEVVWDKHYPKPTAPWLVIFIDQMERKKWHKSRISKLEAQEMAVAACGQLQDVLNKLIYPDRIKTHYR